MIVADFARPRKTELRQGRGEERNLRPDLHEKAIEPGAERMKLQITTIERA